MTMTARHWAASAALAIVIANPIAAAAQDGAKPKPGPAPNGPDKAMESEIAKYCGNFAPSAAEARVAFQIKRLAEIETEVGKRIAELERREADAREWVQKREALLKSANDDVVAIYAKMDAEAAAAQIAVMDDASAAAILAKLKPGAASAILGAMDADKAARLTSFVAGAAQAEKKS
jgi:flagellar motility protein MotE (MotC chaperone)